MLEGLAAGLAVAAPRCRVVGVRAGSVIVVVEVAGFATRTQAEDVQTAVNTDGGAGGTVVFDASLGAYTLAAAAPDEIRAWPVTGTLFWAGDRTS